MAWNASGRSGPLSTVAKIVFALPFLGFGVGAFSFALWRLAGEGTSSEAIGLLPFGLIFTGAGAMIVRQAFVDTRSKESRAELVEVVAETTSDVLPPAREPLGGYRTAAGGGRSAAEVYGTALAVVPVQKVASRPGQVLGSELTLHDPSPAFWQIFMALVWNAFVWPFFVIMLVSGQIFPVLFLTVFVAVGVYLLVATTRRILGRRRLPRVEVSAEPVFLGDELRVCVDQLGPGRFVRYRVAVRCEEIVKYTVGTDTRTETHEVREEVLLDEVGLRTLGLGERWTHSLSVVLPAEGPPSFEAKHNQVLWTVRVRAEIAGWPDYDEGFVFRALPKPVTPGGVS